MPTWKKREGGGGREGRGEGRREGGKERGEGGRDGEAEGGREGGKERGEGGREGEAEGGREGGREGRRGGREGGREGRGGRGREGGREGGREYMKTMTGRPTWITHTGHVELSHVIFSTQLIKMKKSAEALAVVLKTQWLQVSVYTYH